MAEAAAGGQVVSDLRLVAVTPGRGHLVLEDDDNHQFRLPVDERLANALRARDPDRPDGARRDGQLEIALESQLTPREIQARVRAGHSVEEVALAAGISAERAERYAGPVLAERAHVVELAQRAPGRRATGGTAPALAELVEARLCESGSATELRWDAWRGYDDRWTVSVTYPVAGRDRVATWTFDPRGRVLAPADEQARWLAGDAAAEHEPDDRPAAIRRLAAVRGSGHGEATDPAAGSRADEVYDREADETRRAVAHPAARSEAAAAGRSRRPRVPAWEDIMFGPRRRD